ncbi:hypothetical protein [Rathayibacter sp. PhB127]|uniref:hypothetical protein n=1 Tax=Rathayibacter sp. PhB127 TaxID=2485176 RepID=UPI0011CEC180|nr:hypothetical protein [Rathayibacter sp. PhB127]
MLEFTTTTAPWFFVAGLAGGFAVLGTLLTLVGSRINEKAKETRALKSRERDDLLNASTKLLVASSGIREIAIKRLSRNDAEYLLVYGKQMPPRLDAFKAAVESFQIEAPRRTIESKTTQTFLTATTALALPIFTNQEIKDLLGRLTDSTNDFRNQVRIDRGAKPVKYGVKTDVISDQVEKSITTVMQLIGDAVEKPEENSPIRESIRKMQERLKAASSQAETKESTLDEDAPNSDPDKS